MGSPDYCERPYNQLAQVCTHNAYSTEADGFLIPTPNQTYGLTRQLDDGVRCLMLDTYAWEDDLWLCHGICGEWGARPLVEGLAEVAAWLDANPREVVTFILEAYISEDQTRGALEDSGLWPRVYHHGAEPGSPWPTVGEMLDADQRLVVFTDDGAANREWHLDWAAYGFETPYDDPTFTCADNRGDPTAYDHQIFVLNHYTLCTLGGCEENALVNNAYDFAYPRARQCWLENPDHNPFQQIPTFINVDHHHAPDGEIFEVAAALNAEWPG